jgi:hypothetical protein
LVLHVTRWHNFGVIPHSASCIFSVFPPSM